MTYDFKCNICGKDFTIEKSINDDSEIECKCGSKDIKRIYKSTSTIWKCNGAFGKSK